MKFKDIIQQYGIRPLMYKCRLSMLKMSINQFYRNSHDPEIIELRDNVKRYGIRVFCGNFASKYENFHAPVMSEENEGYFYVMHNGAKLFFIRHSCEQDVSDEYMLLCQEQDPQSPHRYVEDYSVLKDCYVVEVGAAEGSFSLDALINGCKKVYICECKQDWMEPLNKTFSQYGDRVEIIQKYVCASDSEDTTTIDSIFRKAIEKDGFDLEKDKIFIKMDIEGMEEMGISGGGIRLSMQKI